MIFYYILNKCFDIFLFFKPYFDSLFQKKITYYPLITNLKLIDLNDNNKIYEYKTQIIIKTNILLQSLYQKIIEHNTLYDKHFDNFILEITYTIGNTTYKYNSKNNLNIYLPVYNNLIKLKKPNRIYKGTINNIDITDILNEYAGPKRNFYIDTKKPVILKNIIETIILNFNENSIVEIEDNFLNEYSYNYPFDEIIILQ